MFLSKLWNHFDHDPLPYHSISWHDELDRNIIDICISFTTCCTIWVLKGCLVPRHRKSSLFSGLLISTFSICLTLVSQVVVFEHDNPISKKLMTILNRLREKNSSSYPSCRLVRQGEQPRELSLFLANLIEDPTAGSSSYVDWILQVHRQSQS